MKLEQEKRKNGYNTFMVTSTMPDEGKSTISTNLALSLADKGYKVILVDLDLRNPSIVQAIQSDGSRGTIVDYLRGKYPIREIITHYEEFKLDITYGTSSGEDAAELLSGERFRKLIATLKEDYDYVILDAPPLYMMGDALLIGQVSDSALVVIAKTTPTSTTSRTAWKNSTTTSPILPASSSTKSSHRSSPQMIIHMAMATVMDMDTADMVMATDTAMARRSRISATDPFSLVF